MHEELISAIKAAAGEPGEDGTPSVSLQSVRRLAAEHRIPPLEVEIACLESGVVPLRYRRNIGTVGLDGQLKLLRSCVGICGLGGLGGYTLESLARFGIGRLILADCDVFEESNLNRQRLCRESDLGRPKVERALETAAEVNSSVIAVGHHRFVQADNVTEIFQGADLIVDALDTVSCRLALQEGCGKLGIPMVHGAIAGTCGQVMTVFPGDPGLKAVYATEDDRGVETVVGNPPPTPALVASLQAQEAVKIVCGGELLRNGFLLVDTASNLYQFIPLA